MVTPGVKSRPSTPDHPPYAEMIQAAIRALAEEDGSTAEAIDQYIKSEYHNLPFGHHNLFPHYIRKLIAAGEIHMSPSTRLLIPNPPQGTTLPSENSTANPMVEDSKPLPPNEPVAAQVPPPESPISAAQMDHVPIEVMFPMELDDHGSDAEGVGSGHHQEPTTEMGEGEDSSGNSNGSANGNSSSSPPAASVPMAGSKRPRPHELMYWYNRRDDEGADEDTATMPEPYQIWEKWENQVGWKIAKRAELRKAQGLEPETWARHGWGEGKEEESPSRSWPRRPLRTHRVEKGFNSDTL